MSAHRCGRAIWVALLLMAAVASPPAGAEDAADPEFKTLPPPPSSVAGNPAGDLIQVPSGGRPLVIARLDSIPRQLRTAIERVKCSVTDSLMAKFPILIFRPADGRSLMAVAPCFGRVPDSRAFLFERSAEQEPMPMTFPVLAPAGGISASSRPGLMSWEPQSQTLIAWRGSDRCPAREIRHTYRQGGGELNGFALSRIEHRQLRCATPEADWQMLWQTPVWNLQP
jgi:hypothetical protein